MRISTGTAYSAEVLEMDGTRFENCSFENCTLDYAGGEVIMASCKFVNCRMLLRDGASRTAALLQSFGYDCPKGNSVMPVADTVN